MKAFAAASVLCRVKSLGAATERRIVVAGSENRTSLAYIDFTNPSVPILTYIDPGFNAGVRVALGTATIAAGSVLSGEVRLIDLTNGVKTLRGAINTGLSGIGAIASRGSLVAVGESVNSFKARVSLIDYSRPDSPVLLSSAQTPLISSSTAPDKPLTAISSLTFLSDQKVIASGQGDFRAIVIDFSNPASPAVSTFFPRTGNPPVIDADSAHGLIVAGDSGGRLVKVFSELTLTEIGEIATSQPSVNSVALSSAGFALASSSYSFTVDKMDLTGLTATSFSPGLSGGLVTAADDIVGVCGEINGSRVALLDLSGVPRVVSVMDSGLASISTLATGTLTVSSGSPLPHVAFTPLEIVFPMTRLTSTASLSIQNTGGSVLNIQNIRTSDTRFSSSASAISVSAYSQSILRLKFIGINGGGQYRATLSFLSNDPQAPNVSIALIGTVGVS
jgi:WD40 repeat protein